MKVYFNNSCKICKAEIDLYKKEKIQDIDWIDITDNTLATKETSKNDKELLRRLHVKDGEKVLEGAEAFLLVWKKIPKYKFLYNFFRLPIIFNIFSFAYEIIAFFLYLKNKKQFVGFNGEAENLNSILLKNNNLHIDILIVQYFYNSVLRYTYI